MSERISPWMPLEGSSQAVALEVLLHGPLSRSELARRMQLSHASLTRLTKPLVFSGLLVEAPAATEKGEMGRPKRPLDVAEGEHRFLGVKLTRDRAYAVATTIRGLSVWTGGAALERHAPQDVVAAIVELVAGARAAVGELDGLGVSLGGRVGDGRFVAEAAFLEWTEVDLGALLAEATGLPAVVENDLTALTESERWFGAGRETETFTVLTIGAGIGYGLVSHGRLVTSPDAGLGPIGHIRLASIGPRCAEGHAGCAAAVLTADALRATVATATGRWMPTEEILERARAGETAPRRAVEDAGQALGRLAGTAAAFSLSSHVVLAGELVALAELAGAAVQAGAREVRHPRAEPLTLQIRGAGFEEWARAAAVLAIQAFVTGR